MKRAQAMPWLRSLLAEHRATHSSKPCPDHFCLFGVHSRKATLLAWARQLHLDLDLRRHQGHHRYLLAQVACLCIPETTMLPA